MNAEALKEAIRQELPHFLQTDPALRAYILDLTRREYAPREDTQDRFYEILAELRHDREAQTRKWEEQNRKWDEHQAEQARKWEEHQAEQARKWDEQDHKWVQNQAEHNRKWEANQQELQRLHEEIMAHAKKYERGIGALGSRWGLQSEKAFRDALAAILEKSFNVEVLNINEYDDQGEVFGRPDQIELDVIIHNGSLIICELKSSIDKAGMYIFERKARFYEKRHQRTATRLMVISPMIDARARKVAEQLGIETYGDSILVESL